jgi:hypothetical protein
VIHGNQTGIPYLGIQLPEMAVAGTAQEFL